MEAANRRMRQARSLRAMPKRKTKSASGAAASVAASAVAAAAAVVAASVAEAAPALDDVVQAALKADPKKET